MMEQILSALDSLEGRKFAVMDGAHFEDLPSSLQGLDLPLHPLYREEADPDLQGLGPFLVPLRDRLVARQLHALADERPALVWWSWPDEGERTEDAVYQHIRSLNLVEVPADTPEQDPHGGNDHPKRALMEPAPPDHCDHPAHHHGTGSIQPPRQLYEPALLRHADPKVMAALLPLLNARQVSRLFGHAGGIVLECPVSRDIRCFARPGHLPPAPQGMLRVLPAQYGRLIPSGDKSLYSPDHH